MNILDFGAKRGAFCGDAIQRAIDAAAAQGGGRVSVPAGEYETASLILRSNVELHLEAGAVLRFVDDFDAYPVVNIRWEGYEQPCHRPLVYAKNEVNVALTGLGTLEGQGPKWWTAFREKTLSAARPCAVCFEDCTRVRMSDFVVRNSPSWTIHPVRCEDVTIDKLTIANPFDSPNTDGIDPESCRNVRITGCHIDVGDDCIAVKAGTEDALENVPCENIAITGCTMVHGHGGVVLGSEMSGGIRRVSIAGCVFDGTDRGIRIKSRRGRGGVVEDVSVTGVVMNDVLCPLVVNLMYFCGKDGKLPIVSDPNAQPVTERTPHVRRIRMAELPGDERGAAARDAGGADGRACARPASDRPAHRRRARRNRDAARRGIRGNTMSYEKTVWAGEGTLAREQEYNYHWCYERGIITKAWMDVYAATGDRRFYDAAKANVDQYVTADGEILTYEPDKYNLDMICMGRTALRLFKATGEAKYEKACRRLIEQIKGQPTTTEGGFWHKKLYPQQMWLDGIYMACPFLTEFAVTFGEMQWADLAAKQMTLIFDKTRLESGLHAHAWDSARAQRWADPQTGLSPHVWGRAMGWFVMAHADVLAVLPESHPAYARLSLQMKSLLHAVMAARGTDKLWHQVMDRPESAENYAESSCSAMFIYGLAKGKALGLCGAKEEAAARESMDALWAQNVVTAADGYPELTRICKVAGLGGEPYRDGSYGYYVHETVCSGDTKGTAPFLMACCALEV